ncbi:MAG: amidohydrolase family protein [Planctomycetaceae bacterium]|nr:amidohydrolase family protein [Planctomycetaceae bacterium]
MPATLQKAVCHANLRNLWVAALLAFSPGLQPAFAAENEPAAAPKPAANAAVQVFTGARILTAAGKTFDPGTLVVQGGKITAVGPTADVEVPAGAKVYQLEGRTLIPGLVDSHSHLGVYSRPLVQANRDGGESSGSVQGIVRALDAINPFDPGIRMAHAGGVTTANIMPGSGNVIGGQTIYVKLRGRTPEEMWLGTPDNLGGLKMANGENPKNAYRGKGGEPLTRMKVAALQRQEFLKARNYQQKWKKYHAKLAELKDGEEAPEQPDRDLALEPLVEVLEGRRMVHFHSHRADDILTVLRLKREFGFSLLLQHGTEGYKIVEELAQAKVPVSMTILDSPGGKAEIVDFIEECGAEFHKAGVPVLINTDDPITSSRFLLRTAAIAVRGGLNEEVALEAITRRPAEVMRLDDRVGSLQAGLHADFVVLSGSPFSIYTRVLETWIEGERVFDLNDKSQRLYQTGGFSVADAERIPPEPGLLRAAPAGEAPVPPAGAARATKDSENFAIIARVVHTVSQGSLKDAVVIVRDGKIAAVGPRADVAVPKNLPVLTAAAVTPGLIDASSLVPLAGEYNIPADQDADEGSNPSQADVGVLDAFNPAEPLLRFLLEQGVTTIHACPGRKNVIAGHSGVFRTHGRTAEDMVIRYPQAMVFNLGESSKGAYSGRRPTSRLGTAALIRKSLLDATSALRKQEAQKKADTDQAEGNNPADPKQTSEEENDTTAEPETDLAKKHLMAVASGEVPALFMAHRADDCLTALRLMDEFKLDGVLGLATEGYLVREQIAKAKVPVLAHPPMQRVGSMETFNTFLGNPATLADSGIPLAITSGAESYVPKTRVVRHEAGIGMVYGLGFQRALRSITLDAAKILKIDEQVGSIDSGKTADLVLYDGDPFEHSTHVINVISGGQVVFDRAQRPRIPLAERMYYSLPNIPCCVGF